MYSEDYFAILKGQAGDVMKQYCSVWDDESDDEQQIVEQPKVNDAEFYAVLDARYFSIAEKLWDEYNCESLTDLFDAFVTYIEQTRKVKSDLIKLQQFAIPRSMIKHNLSVFDSGQHFYPLFNGKYINVDAYIGQRLNTIELLSQLGIRKQLLGTDDQQQFTGYVSYSLETCLRQFNLDKTTDQVPIQICRPFNNNHGIDRQIQLVSIDEIQQLLRQDVQLDQVVHRHFSENVLFYLDVDLKNNYGQIDVMQRQLIMSSIHSVLVEVLQIYGSKTVETIVVGRDILQSCHIYTNTPVRIDDCSQIVNMIRCKLIGNGFDKKTDGKYLINTVIDHCVYPKAGKSQIRFPGSLKFEMIGFESDDSEDDEQQIIKRKQRTVIPEGYTLNRFVLQPLWIRNITIKPSFAFNDKPMWQLNITTRQIEDSESEDEQNDQIRRCYELMLQQKAREKALKQQIIAEYKLIADGYRFKNSSNVCSVCNKSITDDHVVSITVGQTHWAIKCPSNRIEVQHSERQAVEEIKTEVVQSSSIVDQFQLQHLTGKKYTYETDCPVCKKHHNSHGNRVVFLNEKTDSYTLTCVRSRRVLSVRKTTDNTTVNQVVECQLEQQPATQNRKYLRYNALNSRISFVKSAVGTGKTAQIAKAIHKFQQENNREAQVLFLSTRVSFSHTITEQMQNKYGLKFDLYCDQDIDIRNSARLMIQIESLPRIQDRLMAYDFVIIDEAVSVVMQMCNPIAKQAQIIATLQKFIGLAQHIVVCDALLNYTLTDLYRGITDGSEQTIINAYKPYLNKNCDFIKCDSTQQMKQQYLNMLIHKRMTGERVYSFFDRRQDGLQTYYDAIVKAGIFKPEEILILHGDNALDEIDDYDNVKKHHIQKKKQVYKQGDERISKYQLIMTTSTITVGWDSQIDKGFHGIHVLFKMENTNAVHVYQNVHRLRNIQSQTFLHTINKINYSQQPVTITQYFNRMYGDRYITDRNVMQQSQQFILQLLSTYEVLINTLNRHKINILQAFMRDLGYNITFNAGMAVNSQIDAGNSIRDKDVFIPFDCDEHSLQLFRNIHTNGLNTIQNADQCVTDDLKSKLTVYNSVMKQVYLGKLKWDQQSHISVEEQQRCFDLRNNRSLDSLYGKLHKLQPIFDAQDDVQCDNVILKHSKLQRYATRILRMDKQEADLIDRKEILQLYSRVLYLSFVTDNNHSNKFAWFVQVHDQHRHLFDIDCPRELAIQCLKVFGLEYSAKSVSEMIKDCQLRFTSKQIGSRVDRQRQYSVQYIEI